LQLVEAEWVQELNTKFDSEDIVYHLLYAFFLFASDAKVPSLDDKAAFWNFACEQLNQHENEFRKIS
jgi:hypothetical protein